MVANIIGFSSSLVNAELLRSILFMGTANPPPNAVKWLHRQCWNVTLVNGDIWVNSRRFDYIILIH